MCVCVFVYFTVLFLDVLKSNYLRICLLFFGTCFGYYFQSSCFFCSSGSVPRYVFYIFLMSTIFSLLVSLFLSSAILTSRIFVKIPCLLLTCLDQFLFLFRIVLKSVLRSFILVRTSLSIYLFFPYVYNLLFS